MALGSVSPRTTGSTLAGGVRSGSMSTATWTDSSSSGTSGIGTPTLATKRSSSPLGVAASRLTFQSPLPGFVVAAAKELRTLVPQAAGRKAASDPPPPLARPHDLDHVPWLDVPAHRVGVEGRRLRTGSVGTTSTPVGQYGTW